METDHIAELGFETVTFNEITHEKKFWQDCRSCVNYDILECKCCKNCLCTAMLYTPAAKSKRSGVGDDGGCAVTAFDLQK